MNRPGMFAVIAVVAGACTAQSSVPAVGAGDSAAVAALVHDRLRAAQAGDTAAWHRLVSDSCLWTGAALRVATTREVLPGIVANRLLHPADQQIRELVVHVTGDVAQAVYVQQVQDAGQTAAEGKRFRKADTFVRRGGTWLLIGAAEVAVPFRRQVIPSDAAAARLVGRYALGDIDTLTVAATSAGRFTMRGRDGAVDTLLAESDSVLFEDGDQGSWVFTGMTTSGARSLRYRSAGAADVTLLRVR